MTELIEYVPFIGNFLDVGTDVTDEIPHTPKTKWRTTMIVLKLTSAMCEFIYETLVLSTKVIPFVQGVTNHTNNEQFDEQQYERGAHAYIAFYVIGLLGIIAYWVHHFRRGNHPKYGAVVLGVTTEMPLMMSEMVMLKAGGTINWENEKSDLLLQMFFLVNIIVGTGIDLLKWVTHKRKGKHASSATCCRLLLIFVLVLVLSCMIYAPVTWVYAGFHLRRPPKATTFDNSRRRCDTCSIFGVVVDDGEKVMDFLLFVGYLGNWIIVVTCGFVVMVAPWLRLRVQRKRRHDLEMDDNPLVDNTQTDKEQMQNEELVKTNTIATDIDSPNAHKRSSSKDSKYFGANSWTCGRSET